MEADPGSDALSTLRQAQQATLSALGRIDSATLSRLSQLTLPEVHALQEEIARVLPVGNLPAFILSGLITLKGRQVRPEQAREDVHALMQGMRLLPQGLYGLFIAGPAVVLHGYQRLLQLAGKTPESAFPEGTWQFYLQFGLREDTARHTNEVCCFPDGVPRGRDEVRWAAAWLLTAIELLYGYEDLLTVDWRERVLVKLLGEVAGEVGMAEALSHAVLTRAWNAARPYRCPPGGEDYLRHRAERFERFFQAQVEVLPPTVRAEVRARYATCQAAELSPYLKQMTLLAALSPTRYSEEKEPVPLWKGHVALIWQGESYLFPLCERDAAGQPLYLPAGGGASTALYPEEGDLLRTRGGSLVEVDRRGRVLEVEGRRFLGTLCRPSAATLLGWVSAIIEGDASASAPAAPTLDLLLAETARAEQARLRAALPAPAQAALAALRTAPIIVNWDLRASPSPLGELRRDHRGIGDHALTLFRTERSVLFDQSHIFFDGVGGMALAEIAADHAHRLYRALPAAGTHPSRLPLPLALQVPTAAAAELRREARRTGICVESDAVNVPALARLRTRLRQRGASLTINDLLLLCRVLHARTYTPSAPVLAQLDELAGRLEPEVYARLRAQLEETLRRYRETNPALLIPMDASQLAPRERLFPSTFRNPLPEIPGLFAEAQAAYLAYRQSGRGGDRERFAEARRVLLAHLRAFGELLALLKDVTLRGESFSTATLRLLAHLPPSMQHLLDSIPQRIGMLNEIVKGNEVFSNVGRVAAGSRLCRFMSAKDDGAAKELVWGFMTDDAGVMHVSLRDFRPFIAPLLAQEEEALARALAQDYLDRYVRGLNRFADLLGSLLVVRSAPPEGGA